MRQPDYITVRNGQVSVYDVKDLHAFVRGIIGKTRLRITDPHEHEELFCEGLAIALKLAAQYKPHMEGYEVSGSFAGYLSIYLPRKIFTAWHNLHPHHVQVTEEMPDGSKKKRYEYREAPRSLNELGERNDDEFNSDRLRTVGDFASE